MLQPDTAEGVDLLAQIEPGVYGASITAATPKLSKKGGQMLEVKVDVQVNGKTKKRTSYVMVAGPGAAGFDQLLRACHFDELADNYKTPGIEHPAFDEQTLVNQTVNVVIDTQLYEGQSRDQIKGWLRA